jgi:hypothetical protein
MNWDAILFLGAYHGINPGMGWLFAVALGMQRGSARGVWSALPPIALGHAASVAVVLLAAGLAQMIVPLGALRIIVASTLILLGLYRLWRHRHPRFGGMQVGFRDLAIWSFLMASAHGAGFMVLPFVMGASSVAAAAGPGHAMHSHLLIATTPRIGAIAVALHTLAYLFVMALAAWLVYWKLGLRLLRTAWFNLDWLWAGALVVTGLVVLAS